MIKPEVLDLLRKESAFFDSPVHGVSHWQTVEQNGHYLADFNGADKKVISYFAYFHDCMRENEYEDSKHGLRGAQFAKKHRKLTDLTEIQFKQLRTPARGTLMELDLSV